MTQLTKPMRAALQAARRIDGLRRTHDPTKPGKPPWPAPAATLAALVRHELVTRTDDRNRRGHPRTTWTITDAGRQALEPVERFREEKPLYLGSGAVRYRTLPNGRQAVITDDSDDLDARGYTTDPSRSTDRTGTGAVPAVLPEDLNPRWQNTATRRHAAAQDRRTHARQLARNARAA